ncbi:MAG: ABC transporter substrate-binding protein [Firmicutes bacterium]|nr:ABC transporter substrate-binding protein [Bacillota bacterium]
MFNSLVEFAQGSTDLVPGLATSWEVSDDGLTYTFHLRKGVKFHDGTPFNAEAVKFSIERQIDPNHPYHDTGEFAYADFTFGMVKEVNVIDDYTVEIVLKEPFAPFLANMAMHSASIVSPTAVKKYGADFSKHPVGTGPFKFVKWTPGVEVIQESNPDYWDGEPEVKRVIYRPVLEDQARLAELEAGKLDFIVNIPPDDLDRVKKLKGIKVQEQPGMHVWYVVFNTQKEPFNDPRVRQAVNYAIDKKAIVDGILQGTGVLAENVLPPVVWGYNPNVKNYPYDPVKAKQLLAEAGYPNGFKVTLWVPEGGSGMQQPVAMCTAIQAYLSMVGIQAEIQQFEWGTYLDKVFVDDYESMAEMHVMSWIGDNGDPDNFLYILLSSEQWPPYGFNEAFYKNPEVDRLLRQARVTSDVVKRTELYKKAQELIMADAPWVPIDHETQIVAMDERIQGFKLHPTGVFRFEKVTIKK